METQGTCLIYSSNLDFFWYNDSTVGSFVITVPLLCNSRLLGGIAGKNTSRSLQERVDIFEKKKLRPFSKNTFLAYSFILIISESGESP